MKLKFKRMHNNVKLPVYATSGAACFEIHAYIDSGEETTLSNGDTAVFDTGLQVEVPSGYVMMIYSRSGHGFKNDVRLSNSVGVIDSDYRGELKVKLHADFNNGADPLIVKNGDRIAQGMLVKLPKVEVVEVEELSITERGEGGFGSTGQ